MAVIDDIAATYRGPRRMMARLLSQGRDEARVLAWLLAGLIVAYVAQWPVIARADALAGAGSAVPAVQRYVAAFLGVLALIPVFYLVAALSRLVMQLFRGRGSFHASRLVLFWAFLALAPVMLVRGLVAGFAGPGVASGIVDGLALVAFLWFWFSGLTVAEFGEAG
ncbi:MAG: YIP1 family protein [Rhodobacteraceae bacterium]|nr:YIP1 family protein [Paracoccaceae bacterium]